MEFLDTLSENSLRSTAHVRALARARSNSALGFNDRNEALHSSVCLGIAAELLLKHLLAAESTTLLADLVPKDKEQAIYARSAFASDVHHIGLSEIHSCTADDAYFMHKRPTPFER